MSLAAPSQGSHAGPHLDIADRGPVAGAVARGCCSQGGTNSEDLKGLKFDQNPSKRKVVQTPAGSQSAAVECSSIGKVFIPHWFEGSRNHSN